MPVECSTQQKRLFVAGLVVAWAMEVYVMQPVLGRSGKPWIRMQGLYKKPVSQRSVEGSAAYVSHVRRIGDSNDVQ
jgi:hypothetical protein